MCAGVRARDRDLPEPMEVPVPQLDALPPAPVRTGPLPPALAGRRWCLVLAPVLAGVLAIVGAAADPAVDQDGRALFEAYAADPDAVQVKSMAYHLAYSFWAVAALLLAGLVRRRGSWLANAGGALAFLAITTIPGFLLADFYDSAIGRQFGADGALAVEESMSDMWALTAMAGSGVAGLILCLPVATAAAWRAGLLPWWTPVAATAGIVGGFFVVGANVPGAAIMAVGFVVVSVALARIDAGAWAPAPTA
jgi:hypothetical protein